MVDFSFTEDFFGLVYDGNLMRYLDWQVFFYGAYSPNELDTIALAAEELSKQVSGPLIAWDVGGNIAHHSMFISTKFDQVHAFEPVLPNIEVFEQRMAANPNMPIRLHKFALGNEVGTSTIYYPPPDRLSNSGTASLYDDYNVDNNLLSQDIAVFRGDDLIEKGEIPKPALIKIDVEGFEWEVFQGLRAYIIESTPVVITEMSPRSWAETDKALFETIFGSYTIFEIGLSPWTRKAVYAPFQFGSSKEIVMVPNKYGGLINKLRF